MKTGIKTILITALISAAISGVWNVLSYASNAKMVATVRDEIKDYDTKADAQEKWEVHNTWAKEHEAVLQKQIADLTVLAKDSNDRIQRMQGQLELLLKDKRMVELWPEIRAAARARMGESSPE